MKPHLLQAHWPLTGFLGWNLLASTCSWADRVVLARAGIERRRHRHRGGGEKTSPRLVQAHTAAEPRSPAGKLSQGVGTALRPPSAPRLCFLRCLGEGGDLAFAVQQPPPAFPEPAALRLLATAGRRCQVGPGAGWGPGQGWAAAVLGLLLQSVAFKPLLLPCLREFCQRRLSEEPASRPTPTFQNRGRVVQSKGRQRPPRSLGARPCYVRRLYPLACLSVST